VTSLSDTSNDVNLILIVEDTSFTLATGRWFSSETRVSSTNNTDHHDIVELFLKVALNTVTLTLHILLHAT
jgi:hypothetical protein